MNNDQRIEYYQKIIDKIIGKVELTSAEKTIVETDDGFKEYRMNFNFIEKGISFSAMEKKPNNLKDLEKTNKDDKPKKAGLGRRSIFMVAIAVILLLASYFLLSDDSGPRYDPDLLAMNHHLHHSLPNENKDSSQKSKDDPYFNYTKRNYVSAVKDLKKLGSSDNNPKHKFYLAVSLLGIEKWKAAEKILEHKDIIQLKNYPTNFYLAISKIGLSKTEEAIKLLQNPRSGQTEINLEAEKILKKLQRK